MSRERYNVSMGNQFLGLSLFIMLLSFFIVLNSLSSFDEERSQPIVQSLSVAFSTEDREDPLDPSIEPDPAENYEEGSTLDKIKGLFKAQIASLKIQKNRLGTMMHIRMPREEFEKAIVQPLNDPTLGLTERFSTFLVSLMKTDSNVPYRMDILLNIDAAPGVLAQDDPEALKSAMSLVSGYSFEINQAGLPSYQLSAGLRQGDPDMIDLYFRPHVPFNPLQGQLGQGARGG